MASLGWLVLALFASLLALLAVPVDVEFSLRHRAGRQQGDCALGWLFGAVRVPLFPRVRDERKPSAFKPARSPRSVMFMLQTEGLGRQLLKLARGLLRRIHVRTLSLDVRLGLDDPADTGRLWAVVGPLAALLPLPPVARFAIEPDFADAVFEAEGQGRVRLIPIQCLPVILVFVLSPATLRALRASRPRAR